MANNWVELGQVWSGRDLDEGERVTVSVLDKATQTLLEQATFVSKAGRLGQYTWVMDLCKHVNAQLQLIRAGVPKGDELEIPGSCYLNKFWGITDRNVQVITTTASENNWTANKRIDLHLSEDVKAGSTLQLKVCNSKGQELETISFKSVAGRCTRGLCAMDFATEINRTSLYVRAGFKCANQIAPALHITGNWVWIPFNAELTVTFSIDQSSASPVPNQTTQTEQAAVPYSLAAPSNWTDLGQVWSGRDLDVGERVTISVLDSATQTMLEQATFVAKAGRLGQYTWVMDLCKQVNAELKLIRAGVPRGDKLEIPGSCYLNRFWGITGLALQVITTTASENNWATDKRVHLNLTEDVKAGSTLQLKVRNSQGQVLESLSFQSVAGRCTRGLCARDFAAEINRTSLYVRAGFNSADQIDPVLQLGENWIWVPFNADLWVSWSIDPSHATEHDEDWSIDLSSTWTELGDVRAGRNLTEGERVTVNVFDKATDTVLEQTTFVPTPGRLSQYIWLTDLCRHVNGNLKLIRAGAQDATGNWDILLGDAVNKYWTWSRSELEVITTVAHVDNWDGIHHPTINITQAVGADAVLRVNVRNKFRRLLETITFTPAAGRTAAGPCGHDFASHINNTSHFLRAGAQSPDNPGLIQPDLTPGSNLIWIPANANYSASWTTDAVTEACKISADRDALEGERITFFAFDKDANYFLEHIVLTARASANTLAKDKWPAALAKLINDSSAHASATATAISQKYADLRLFSTALHLDNWVQDTTIAATAALTAADRIVVKVATQARRNFCEAVTFTPDPARLAATQWAKDLAAYINEHSLYLKAGVKDSTKKTIVPTEHASSNVIWIPQDSMLTVTFEKTQLRELAPISLHHDLAVGEKSYVYVMDDETDVILREIAYTPTAGRAEQYSEAHDFAAAIDKATELVVAGHKVGDAVPVPTWSSYQNKIWGCASTVRAFHTMLSLGNWDQGAVIGDHDLVENEQVVVNIKGKKSGRILETLAFTPKADRLTQTLWPKDFASMINKTSKFIRAGRENTTDDKIEPWHQKDANTFWTPKGSGLEVEMQTLQDIAKPLPGMSSETVQLFEQCMESRKHVTVDARTGEGVLRIPLAELFADDSLKNPLAISLSYEKTNGLHVQVGSFLNRVKLVTGTEGTEAQITLRDGRVVGVNLGTISLNGGDFIIRPFSEEVATESNGVQSVTAGYVVTYKDGSRDTFRFFIQTAGEHQVNWTQYRLPSGLCLDLKYNFFGLEQVTKGEQVLMKVDWHSFEDLKDSGMWRLPKTIVIFPDSKIEKRTFTFVRASCNGQQTSLHGDGFATSGKVQYLIKRDRAGNLTSFEAEHQHAFDTAVDKAMHRETLEYDGDNRITRHVVSPGGGMDDLVHDYGYSDTRTTLVGYYKNAVPRAAFVRHHDFNNQQSCVESYGSETAPVCKQRTHMLDTRKKWLVSQSRTWEGDVLVDQQTLALDGIGNPTRRDNNDEITQWTYYNNYQQFRVTETETYVEDWSFFACLFKVIDYANVLGAVFAVGSSSGMTWGTRLDTTVEMLPAVNDYAKKAFDLPVDIVHCGSDRPFSGDVESELVSRRIDGKEVPQRLTFFGYGNFDGHVRAKQKLTILQPDCSSVDVTAEQLAVATKAAAPFVKSLKEQISSADPQEKPGYEEMLKDLNKSVEEQSKANSQSFKLNSKKTTGMTLETYAYHIDKTKPGYGMVASCKHSFVDDKGASDTIGTTSRYAYSLDTADSDKLIIETTVTDNASKGSVTTSQTRSRLTGRLLESTDSEGYKTVRSYDPLGNLLSETISLDGVDMRKTTCTLARNLVWQYEMTEHHATTRVERDAIGRRISQAARPKGRDTYVETHRWAYDKLGRSASLVETDYDGLSKKLVDRETQWSYDASGTVTTTHLLKDSTGKELDKVIRKRTPDARGESFTQGKFRIDRQFDASQHLMTEQYSLTGGEGCKIERSMTPEGLMKSVRYLRVESATKETEQDKIDFTYDKYAQLTKVAPKIGAASSYTYDASGRLLTSTRDGVVLRNSYSQGNLAAAANGGWVKSDTATEVKLGSQSVDFLGRVTEQCAGDNTVSFSYSGASTKGTRTTPDTAPPPMKGYESVIYQNVCKHTQYLYMQNTSSSLCFSLGGRVISFTDLTKAVTTYEYDFFDRLVGSENEHCVCSWTYADNGLLISETVKAVKASDLVMKVEYAYDGLGQEIKRTFTCTGVEISVERTLRGDGRLSKSVIKENGTEKSADSYEYDDCLRLKKWVESSSRTDTYSYDLLGSTISHTNSSSGKSDLFYYVDGKPGMVSQVLTQKTTDKVPDTAPGTANTYDTKGSLTIDGNRRLSYHDNGQVNTYSTDGDTTLYTFSYDSDGRVRGGSNGTLTEFYHYRGNCVHALVQYDTAQGAAFAERTLVLRNESRACLMQDAITDKRESRSFELRDANGTVFASIDLVTKAITYFRYEPYGKRHSGAKADNWLGFKGEPLNSMGLYYLGNGHRLYDPAWGHFLSRDAKSPFGVGGVAGYVFGNADPVNHADPSGREVIAQYSRWLGTAIIQSTAFRIVVGAVGVLLAPFTAGTSMLLAVATTMLAALSFAFDLASIIISESDPDLSRTLESWGQAFGVASAVAGIGMGVNGLKSFPRNWFRVRGGPSTRFPVKWPNTVASELRIAQEARSRALTQLIKHADEAKAAGSFDAFKAAYLNNDAAGTVGGLVQGTGSGITLLQEAADTGRKLFKGTIRQFDDSLFDLLGYTLDANSGPNVLIQKFMPATDSETESRSLVALPMPGRETLFP
ncbi:nematicidal protein 2-like protein [Pseudomonas sp. GD04058]|uniref:RHS repeat-associated core domain-containing protein n=1 Tax=Pseudomonas sp. GD04058 TaxID=2975429 RepID=UPI00244C559A|nr:RHS repeat-associated core domain-containing protein [Pseudomonas sp. GD04058]MDG9885745.1 nematicidal protein 2-like protein [Pseudomonas sp. GD04058]